jgi:hypothetical protein
METARRIARIFGPARDPELGQMASRIIRLAADGQAVTGDDGTRRDWAVVLYSGDCPEHPGQQCAMQAIGPCTLAETSQVAAAVPDGFALHRVALLGPAEFGL